MYRFSIKCNKYTILMVDTDNGKGYAGVGVKSVWEISVFLLNFAVNLKLLPKSQFFFLRQMTQSKRYHQYIYATKNS